MNNDARNEELMTRYLLGELPEAEQLRLEERYFTDTEFSEQLLALENELKYDYARGALSPQARVQFERRFLVTDQDRKEVEFAGTVMDKIAEAAEAERLQSIDDERESRAWFRPLLAFFTLQNPVMRYSLATALIITLIAVWLSFEKAKRRNLPVIRDEVTVSADKDTAIDEPDAILPTSFGKSKSTAKPAIILLPGLARDTAETKRQIVLPGTKFLRLQLNLKKRDRHSSYRAVLTTDDGEELWSRNLPRASRASSSQAVFLKLPTKLLSEGDYELTLKGLTARREFEDIGDYYFTIVKK